MAWQDDHRTPVRHAPEGIRYGTIWAWTNARWVTYFYSPTGDAESVKRFLGADLARTVQCDGTSITNFLERTGGSRPGCWAHYPEGAVIRGPDAKERNCGQTGVIRSG